MRRSINEGAAVYNVIPSAVEGSRETTCEGVLRLRFAPLRMTGSLSLSDLVADRLEAIIVRHLGRAGRQTDDQVHFSAEENRVACFGKRRKDL